MALFSIRRLKPFAALGCSIAFALLTGSSARADNRPTHPCGAVGWMDETLELIRQAPKVDRGWQKSRDTQAMEDIWQMIENPEKYKGKPAP